METVLHPTCAHVTVGGRGLNVIKVSSQLNDMHFCMLVVVTIPLKMLP